MYVLKASGIRMIPGARIKEMHRCQRYACLAECLVQIIRIVMFSELDLVLCDPDILDQISSACNRYNNCTPFLSFKERIF